MINGLDFGFDFTRLPLLDFAASLALVLILLLIRVAAGHAIRRRTDAAPQTQRRWSANVRNLLLFVALLGLMMIWAPQLRTFALSLTAVAVAVVIATKELILCFSGSFIRASSRSFSVGDLIEIAGTRGEVVDHNVFVTMVHEVEPSTHSYTGRTVVLPNSVFLGQPMRNERLMRDYTYHAFSLTLDPLVDVFAHRAEIEAIVLRHYEPLKEAAEKAGARVERHLQADLSDARVRVALRTTELGKYRIGVTVFCPTRLAESLENGITCEVMSYLHGIASGLQREQLAVGDRTAAADDAAQR
ncbi:mechanosensitive ion channel domain-containing protein [Piscinibacter sakaiensis]|uniref:mechanosensitive ion channel domain-containing protein n=1 Tax=Piscinibacter sakaiensis TaxID=1547922 RepID=UPI003AB10892